MDAPVGLTMLSQIPAEVPLRSADRIGAQFKKAENESDGKRSPELKKAAQEFESLFVAYLLKVMRETIEDSGLTEGGFGKSIYTELFDQEISRTMAQRGALGISDILLKRLATEAPIEVSGNSTKEELMQSPAPPAAAPSPASPRDGGAAEPLESEIPDFQLPIRALMSSGFGPRVDPVVHQIRMHKGIDLAAPMGLPVHAASQGEVVFAGYAQGYGNMVVLKHAGGYQTRYAHLGSVNVKAGEDVTSDDVLGVVGSTGRSTGPHLHFEVIRSGEQIDPRSAFVGKS